MDRQTAEVRVDEFPGPRARDRVDFHSRFAAKTTYVYKFVWDVVADAVGPFVTDVDGNVLLDFTSHVGAAPLGYNSPLVLDRLREFDLVDPLKIAGQDFYTSAGDPAEPAYPGPSELMERLVAVSECFGMDTVFLSNSGAEAVENAIKICYDDTGATYGVTFQGAFHGRTLGALSLNRSKSVYRRHFPEIPSVQDVPFCRDRTCTAESCSCGFFSGGSSELRRMLEPDTGWIDADELAYVILEPIQGEGGYHFPSDAFTEEVASVVEEHDVLLIADEIQTGIGRTGTFWASEQYAFEPDVIAAAKGLRVGATIAAEDVFPGERSRLSSTWGAGDIVASAQGVATIDAIREEGLMENAVERGRQFKETLRDADLPGVVDVRGKGLMLAVEFDSKARRDAVVQGAAERGLLTLGCGYRTLRLLPPLDVTEREVRMGVDLLVETVEAVA